MPEPVLSPTASRTQLTATVSVSGTLPVISRTLADAAVADLVVTFTGGTAGDPVSVKLVVTLNGSVGLAPAQLIDDTQPAATITATVAGNAYAFDNVKFPAPGTTAARRFRITNVRVNANTIGSGGTPPVSASVSITSSTPVRLSGAEQTVATIG